MHKISDILNYLDTLSDIDFGKCYSGTRRALDSIRHRVINHPSIGFKKPNHQLEQLSRELDTKASDINTVIDNVRRRCWDMIQELEPEYLARGHSWYHEESRYENCEYIMSRTLEGSPQDHIEFEARIRRHISWQFPGLILRPGTQSWCDIMVAMDPLYVVETHDDLLADFRKRFTLQYQNRLRYYVIDEYNDQPLLNQLPPQQFGLIAAWNFLNYKPLAVLGSYLEAFRRLLRPGGSVIFTFNDCDHQHFTALSESGFMPYTPGRRVVDMSNELGFVVGHRYLGQSNVAWLELKKPGDLTSMRQSTTLATVVERSK